MPVSRYLVAWVFIGNMGGYYCPSTSMLGFSVPRVGDIDGKCAECVCVLFLLIWIYCDAGSVFLLDFLWTGVCEYVFTSVISCESLVIVWFHVCLFI